MQQVCLHPRQESGAFSTLDRHILDSKIAGVERGADYLLRKAALVGRNVEAWSTAMVQARGIAGYRVLQGLLGLADRHPPQEGNRACGIALEHANWRLRTIRELLKRGPDQPVDQQLDLIQEHPIIRNLADYGRLVHDAFLQPSETR